MSEKWGPLMLQWSHQGRDLWLTNYATSLQAMPGSAQGQAVMWSNEPMTEPNPLPLFPSSAAGSHAKITALQENAAAWLATVARSGGKCTGSLLTSAPPGLSEKMFLASSVPTGEETSSQSLPPLFNSGMAAPGLFLTLNTSEWRNEGVACSLSDILEANPDPKFLLSPRACSGIIRRAERRGKELPEALATALKQRAGITSDSESMTPEG